VNCDFINNKNSIFAKFGMCPVRVLRQLYLKHYIVKEFTIKRHLPVKLKKYIWTTFVRTSPAFSCEEFVLEVCPNISDRVIKYENRITQLLSIKCLCIYYTTTCFGQTVRPSSGILQSHINSDLGRGLPLTNSKYVIKVRHYSEVE